MSVDGVVPAAASPAVWFRQPHSDTTQAAERLRAKLAKHASAEDCKALSAKLDAIVAEDDSVWTAPGARRLVVDILTRISTALDLLPDAAHYPGSREQLIREVREAFKAQNQIAKDMSQRIPDNSQYLNTRHATAALVFLVAVLAFLALNVCWPGAPLWFRAVTSIASSAAPFIWGRAADYFGIPGHSDKQLQTFAEAVKTMIFNKEYAEMWNDVVAVRNSQTEMQRQVTALREENAAVKIQLAEQNAVLRELLLRLPPAGHQCFAAANHAEPANDPHQANRVGHYG